MNLAYLAFSETGYELATRLSQALGGKAYRSGQPDEHGAPVDLKEWTRMRFAQCDGLIYVGALGIAVRAIAPFVRDKASDPAVVVIDERALHVIPVLSGHLGGANDLARKIAQVTQSDPVITTATDINGIFAVDEWSKHQNCALLEPKKIVGISGRLLAGAQAAVFSPWSISGTTPEHLFITEDASKADIVLDIHRHSSGLHLVPRICTLGIGCRKGTAADTIEMQFQEFIEKANIYPESICQVATIDLKKDESGLIAFCEKHDWPLITYTSQELRSVEGTFTASEFVSSVTGVDNVCERSAVLASGGSILKEKTAGNGVTLALAARDYRPDWTWKKEAQ